MCDLWIQDEKPVSRTCPDVKRGADGKAIWTDGDGLMVMAAVWNDKGYSANYNVECPVCHTNSLCYDNPTPFDMSAWCDNCHRGIKQGKGAAGS